MTLLALYGLWSEIPHPWLKGTIGVYPTFFIQVSQGKLQSYLLDLALATGQQNPGSHSSLWSAVG